MVKAVQVSGLSYAYPHERKRVLERISFTVDEMDVVGIAGPSGCGKSTLMLALAGLIPHSLHGTLRGNVRLFGKETRTQSLLEISQTVQILFQNPDAQLFALNVEDEVTFGLENLALPWPEIERRTDEALERTGLAQLRRSSPEELSSGQKQKVALAAVLAMQPRILLFDEPTANLDPPSVRRLEETIAQLRRRHTIIIVEHNIDFLQRVSKRLILMDRGRIVAADSSAQVLRSAAFLRTMLLPPKNARRRLLRLPTVMSRPLLLEAEHLSFTYQNGHHAIKDITLQVGKGDFLGIIGMNGSGKSTLALLLIGLLQGKGRIRYDGKDITTQDVAERVQQIGYVFQNPSYQLFAETLRREVAFGPENLKLGPREVRARVTAALEAVGLHHLNSHDPHSLSVGQKRRVSIASVLAMLPEVLIIDEPDTGVDAKTTQQIMKHLKALNQQGKTIVIISHNIDLLATYCNRLVAMKDGEIVPVKYVVKEYCG